MKRIICFILAAIVGLVAGIIIAVCSKKADGVEYGKLDKVGIATNIILIPVYAIITLFCTFIVMLGYGPDGEGILGILGWILSFIGASGSVLCGLGLGASVALRKKGKSKKSFLVQFAGVAGLGITFLFFLIFYGNLFGSLN